MSKTNNGGAAFPAGYTKSTCPPHDPGAGFRVTERAEPAQPGMTLRDYFAARAMQALLGSEYTSEHGLHEGREKSLAHEAYFIADALLSARAAQS